MSEHIEIDFDGDDFCPPPTEQNAIVIWEALSTKYPKFWFDDPSLKTSGNYNFSFGHPTGRSKIHVGSISVGEYINLQLREIPLGYQEEDLSAESWSWALADPKSLDGLFRIMDSIYKGFHQFKEGQTLQLGNKLEIDDVLDKDQTIKKLFMRASEILEVPYQRRFITELQEELKNPEFNRATGTDDWRTRIAPEVRENWHFLDELARLLFWIGAKEGSSGC